MTTEQLLEVEALTLGVSRGRACVPILLDVELGVAVGESVGIVGESGSGKSVTLRAVAGQRPRQSELTGGIRFGGKDLSTLSARELRDYRASDIAFIPQNPLATINPLRRIGDFLVEALVSVRGVDETEALRRAGDALVSVGIGDADRRLRQFPHELSGGLLQRVVIAAALLAEPRLILADEPTTALDVTTQEEVIALLDEMRRVHGAALLLVTHDLDLAAAVTDRIAVMYAGMIVETVPARDLHLSAKHPYTAALLAARPTDVATDRLPTIPGRPASAHEAGDGCVFVARCPFAVARCRDERPTRTRVGDDHVVACHRLHELPSPLTARSSREAAW